MTDRLAEIAARAAALPCEDWRAVETHGIGVSLWNVEHGPADSPGDCYDRFEDPPREVAEFAAHARADVPWLLAEVGRLQDSLTALEKFAREEIHAKTTRLGEALQREYRLKLAILDHHDQKADDRCIEDDDRLYAAAGLSPCDRRVGDKAAMLANCARFIERRCEGGGWPSYAELEAEVERLRRLNEGLTERVAKQSELLSRRAEGHTDAPATWPDTDASGPVGLLTGGGRRCTDRN